MKFNRLGLWSSASAAAIVILAASEARAQVGASNLTGRVTDASTNAPVADVVVTITSPNLQGEETAVTDANGLWRAQSLPVGDYTIRLDKESYKPFARTSIALRGDVTLRVDSQLLPESLKEEVVVVAQNPTVDVGSSNTGLSISGDFARRVPVTGPGNATGGAARSFEAVATATPQASSDTYGTSINGTTSPENNFQIDGLSRNNAGFGVNGARLSIEFVREVNVLTGGYMPEYGNGGGGGIISAITKTGTNEFHGGAWGYVTPGGLEGDRKRITQVGATITTQPSLNNIADVGGEIGGPIVKDKLWFYFGFDVAHSSYNLQRALNDQKSGELYDTRHDYDSTRDEEQFFGKLTWAPTTRNRISLSAYVLPMTTGGSDRVALADPNSSLQAVPAIGKSGINGTPNALFNRIETNTTSVQLDWETQSPSKKVLVKTTAGYMHQTDNTFANDGTEGGSGSGVAGLSGVVYRRNNPGLHGIADFEPVQPFECDAPGVTSATKCPLTTYNLGGPGAMQQRSFDRYTLRSILTLLGEAAGHHVFKAGVEGEVMTFSNTKSYGGSNLLRESTSGTSFSDYRNYAYLTAPDQRVLLNDLHNVSHSFQVGGFIQDSWAIFDKVTLNVGVRWDSQVLWGSDNAQALVLPYMISPRAGIVWDPGQSGHSKLYGNFAQYYQGASLDIADRAGSVEPLASANRSAKVCDPTDINQLKGACSDPANFNKARNPGTPDPRYVISGAGKTPVDSDLKPEYSNELVFGAEHDVFRNARIGTSLTHRWIGRVIEDVSRDQTNTYYVTNPGERSTSDFPKPTRFYTAWTVFFQKTFNQNWEAMVSYTLANLQGNFAGLFRPETGQLDPFINSDYDLRELTVNRSGPLPGDTRHQIKLFGSKTFDISEKHAFSIGGAFRGTSGGPTQYLGSQVLYGPEEVFILPRGSGNRLPWQYGIDTSFSYTMKVGESQSLSFSADIFNLLNFQAITNRDQEYTTSDVNPIIGGKTADLGTLRNAGTGALLQKKEVNPNFTNPTAYQTPRQIRFGIRGTF